MLSLAWAITGAIIGSIGFSMLTGALYEAFRPYPDDMQMWLLYSIPAGAIFGSITGCVLGLAAKQKFKAAGWVSVISSVGLGLLHLKMWPSNVGGPYSTPAYTFAQVGPGLLWSAILFLLSINWFNKIN